MSTVRHAALGRGAVDGRDVSRRGTGRHERLELLREALRSSRQEAPKSLPSLPPSVCPAPWNAAVLMRCLMLGGTALSCLAGVVAPAYALLPVLHMALLFVGADVLGVGRQMTVAAVLLSGAVAILLLSQSGGVLDQAVRLAVALGLAMACSRGAHRRRCGLERRNRELEAAVGELQRAAGHDELTGLRNRRGIQAIIDREARRGARSGSRLCVAVIDVDHFKSINDHFGHAAGDDALRALARQLQRCLRTTDDVGRIGGEEFVLVMSDTDVEDARAPLERMRAAVATMDLPAALEGRRVTISIGFAGHRHGEDAAAVIARADAALYDAKKAGRDRVCWRDGERSEP